MKNEAEKMQTVITYMVRELNAYQASGVHLTLRSRESSPEEIANALAAADGVSYMRDYIQDERGRLQEVRFDPIGEETRDK